MGQNGHGELGFTNTFSGTNRPVLIVPNGVTAISAGYYFSLFLMNDGSLFGMGNDITGQSGDARSNILEFAIEPACVRRGYGYFRWRRPEPVSY